MELLPKIAIILGMVIGVTFFGMVMFMMIPDMIDHNRWDRLAEPISEEALIEKFSVLESYQIFIEKYPENGIQVRSYDNGGGEIRLNAMNFTSLTQVELELDYDAREDNIRQDLECRNDNADWRLHVRGPLSADFLKNVDCLGIQKFTGKNSELVLYDGDSEASYARGGSFQIIAD